VSPGGAAPNRPAVVASRQEEVTRTISTQQNLASREVSSETRAALTPSRVTVSVIVPSDYYVGLWRERFHAEQGQQPGAADAAALAEIELETKAKIEELVSQWLPAAGAAGTASSRVVVTSFQGPKPSAAEPPVSTANPFPWLARHGSTIVLAVVSLFGLLVLRGFVRGGAAAAPASAAEQDAPLLGLDERAELEEFDDDVTTPRRRYAGARSPIRDELADLVRDDPDTAADILKSWISDAA
jgi:flagellar M-ring protein FliF